MMASDVGGASPVVLEVIACTLDDALAAEQGGATRLEVASHPEQEGLTPALRLVEAIVAHVRTPVRVMVRERNTFDVADDNELNRLCAAAHDLGVLPIDGLVLGFTRHGRVDTRLLQCVCAAAPHTPVTFHRAFDACSDPAQTLSVLAEFRQVDWVLTRGGSGDWLERLPKLAQSQVSAQPVRILVGGGVDEAAIRTVCERTPLRAFHTGRAAREPRRAKGPVVEQRVRALRQALDAFGLPQIAHQGE